MKDIVSIITPCYNSSRYIEDCISSVLNQTYNNWELVIVDDASNDNTSEIISKIAINDKRINLTLLKNNVGAAQARNIAINRAKGRYIAFLDSDDLWKPKKLEKQLYFMKEKNIAFSFCSYQFISENGILLSNIIKAPSKMTYDLYLRNTIIGCSTVMIDRDKSGNFQMLNIRSSHDMALWLFIMKKGFSAFGIDDNLAYYRVVSSSNTANKIIAAKEVWYVYRKIEKLNIFYSLFCFISYAINAIIKRL